MINSSGTLRCKLSKKVILVRRQNDGLVLSRHPFTIRRVKRPAIGLLELCDGEHTLDEILAQVSPPVDRRAALSFLEKLAAAEVVSLEYPENIAEYPEVSIIVPVRNRPSQIQECLRSLLSLDYPETKREIIVVDDASEDPTPQEVARYAVKLISMPQASGPAACRNRAIQEASGELVAFIDSDGIAHSRWLSDLVPCFTDPRVGAAGGLIEPFSTDSIIQRYEKVKSPLYQGNRAKEVRPQSAVSYLATCNMLVRKGPLQQIDGFDASLRFGEDVDLIWRLGDKGQRTLYFPKGKVYHHHSESLWGLICKRALYATSEASLSRKHPEKGKLLTLPWGLAGLLTILVVGLLLRNNIITAFAPLPPLIELLGKEYKLFKAKLPPFPYLLLTSTLRSYAVAIYHVLRNLSRYYLILLLTGVILFPPLLWLVIISALLPTLVDYLLLQPKLPFLIFSALSLIENLSYQVGVFLGCIQCKTWRPLFFKIRFV